MTGTMAGETCASCRAAVITANTIDSKTVVLDAEPGIGPAFGWLLRPEPPVVGEAPEAIWSNPPVVLVAGTPPRRQAHVCATDGDRQTAAVGQAALDLQEATARTNQARDVVINAYDKGGMPTPAALGALIVATSQLAGAVARMTSNLRALVRIAADPAELRHAGGGEPVLELRLAYDGVRLAEQGMQEAHVTLDTVAERLRQITVGAAAGGRSGT